MGAETGIEWAGSTWNPWMGCDKVSTGCRSCYAGEVWAKRAGRTFYGNVVRASKATFNNPIRWKDPRRIFVCSLSDFFHPAADKWRADAYEVMAKAPQHTYLILTKRSEKILDRLPWKHMEEPWPNVWIGASVERQQEAYRLNELIQVSAAVRFVSAEPLVGQLTLAPWMQEGFLNRVNWVIVGGESGNRPRLMQTRWVRKLIQECRESKVPIFVKQMGAVWAQNNQRKGKGDKPEEWPTDLRVREFPK